MHRFLILLTLFCLLPALVHAQLIRGTVKDATGGDPVIGANVIIKGSSLGTTTDLDGKFELNIRDRKFPISLEISFIGYASQTIVLRSARTDIIVNLSEDQEMLGEVNIIEQRLSKKQRESALTVEALDGLAIKETPAVNFYEALGNLKGVDLTSASIGFKIINTRGFNSTSPVRSLQIIDGVDNQAPGLNFSLGNFLGASELDVQNVDIIAGASTAFYGPGAFNGVISMTTKNPFLYKGLSASVKVGERAMVESAVRYAEAYKLGNKDYENFAFKINLFFLRANDWEAENYDPVDDSEVPADNPGGYDAVNIYGDEDIQGGNDFRNLTNVLDFPSYAGLGIFYRSGYKEVHLVDYDTRNFKGNVALHYKFNPTLELSYNFNYGSGTTVYQGENRFSLKGISFYQNVLNLENKGKFFIRAYATAENAGESYDAVLTAFKMNQAIGSNRDWNNAYKTEFRNLRKFGERYLDFIGGRPTSNVEEWYNTVYLPSLEINNDTLNTWHREVREAVDNGYLIRPAPGTPEFDSLFHFVTSNTFTEGGSKFYDRSSLYHIMGEHQFHPSWAELRAGANFRLYRPDSRGNIFDEIDSVQITYDNNGNIASRRFFYRSISNWEFGIYGGIEKKLYYDRLKLSATLRMDKNENFSYLFSPAASAVYEINEKNTVRLSFGKAIRNPTLQDQYLRYDVGRAILLGNLHGYDSLVTLESFNSYRNNLKRSELEYFNVAPIVPEEVVTLEAGYRATLFKRIFLDLNIYHNWYKNFIGYQFGLDLDFASPSSQIFNAIQAYRVAANAQGLVTTGGVNIGMNYYFTDELSFNGNYSYNAINLQPDDNALNRLLYGDDLPKLDEVDPIIPAYNTPRNKFNLGITGRGYKPFNNKDHKLGFAATYKWIEGFRFEGSPQFSGFINTYSLLDAQLSYQFPSYYTTLKLGASNLLNNEVYQVYGGPSVGRLAYFSILLEL